MKLRMLNGSHSLLAYAGFVSEHPTIKSCMENPVLRALLRRHLRSTAATLKPLPDFDYDDYAEALIDRFDNPNIAHSTFQIAMDGSQKMRQRIFTPTKALAQRGMAYDTYAFATAAWLRYTSGKTESGDIYRLQDPLEKALISSWTGTTTPQEVLAAIGRIDGLIPQTLAGDPRWKARVTRHLGAIQSDGMIKAAQALLDG
jgi:fructuronate reductase